jgi:outer membrane receptor protein involved in Fe transport
MPFCFRRGLLHAASPFVLMNVLIIAAQAQEVLPEIVVESQRPAPPRPIAPPPDPKAVLAAQNTKFDEMRDNLSPRFGASSFDVNRAAIEALPQGTDTPINTVLLQAPGVSQDSAASGDIHVRNEHANVQYRINGITLPDSISGFGHVLDTGFVGSLAVITGALPAQYGLRTAGVIDIQTPSGNALKQGGTVGIYGGSQQTMTPTFDYGGRAQNTEYFVAGRGFTSAEGIENPTPAVNAIHDRTFQGNFFSYTSTVLDSATRVSTIFGSTTNHFQIPNNPGQPFAPGVTSVSGVSAFDSANVNDNQVEQNTFGVLALQKSLNGLDLQLSTFTRYSTLHYTPDVTADTLFNGQASNVYRRSVASGVQGDSAYKLNDSHTLRGGFTATGESTDVNNVSTVLPPSGADAPFTIGDQTSQLGWVMGAYVQDEWRLTDKLTFNTGLRFDQMFAFTDANQFSPRVNLVYKPLDGTTLHAGYARYFTPPSQVLAGPTNVSAFVPTLTPPATTQQDAVKPERSHYFDAGVTQKLAPGLQVGLDAYYKLARDLLDDGQFGQALVVNAFNYDKAKNAGVELSASYTDGEFKAYGNLAWAKQMATDIVSNQYLFSADELTYIASHYVYTDHAQTWTGSAGASYLWDGTRYSADLIYGSGLRSGDFNTDHVPGHTQVNIGASRELDVPEMGKVTARLSIVNVFDSSYLIRDGSGIGVFAPQYGPRRGYFAGLSKKF